VSEQTPAREAVRAALSGARREDLPGILAEVLAAFLERQAPPAKPPAGVVLTPAEVGQRLNRSTSWVYRMKKDLPVTLLPGGRWGVSEPALLRWEKTRSR
jgi:hypothetical protein